VFDWVDYWLRTPRCCSVLLDNLHIADNIPADTTIGVAEVDRILDFENQSDWKVTGAAAVGLSSTFKTSQSYSLSVQPTGYSTVTSAPLSSWATIDATLSLKARLPEGNENLSWAGAMQAFLKCPSRGVSSAYLGQIELTGVPGASFRSYTFQIPSDTVAALNGGYFSDLTIQIVLNAPSSNTGTYYLDELRLTAATPPNQAVVPTVKCVNRFTATSWNAVFGYHNTTTKVVPIPAGDQNRLNPVPAEMTSLPTAFAPGVIASAFMASFPGGSLTWTLGAMQATASESSPRCTTSDLPPADGPTLPFGAGSIPDMPSTHGLQGIEEDTIGYFRQVDPLQGGQTSVQYKVNGGTPATSIPKEDTFQFTIWKQMMGDDNGWEVETDIDIAVIDFAGSTKKTVNYNNPDDWGTWSDHDGNWPVSATIASNDPYVTVRVSINEHDTFSTDHWVRRLRISNRTGQVQTVMDDSGKVLQNAPLPDHCVKDAGGAGWGFCWSPIQVTGRPLLCASFLAEYIDSGYGQTYLEPSPSEGRVQKVPAAFSYAKYRLTSNVKQRSWGPVSVPERTADISVDYIALDETGCFPADVTPNDEDLQYDKNGKLELEIRFRSQFCRDSTGANCPKDPNAPSSAPRTTSGTRYDVTDKDGKVQEWCVILTSDESLQNSDCDVIHASQGAFTSWAGTTTTLKYVPTITRPTATAQNSMTRVSGVVSTVYVRAIESPDQAGSFLVGNMLYTTTTDNFCKLEDVVGDGRKAVDGCAGSISPSFKCNPGQAIGECAYWVNQNDQEVIIYEPCEVGPSHPDCRPGLNYFKTGIAHEIGHQVHRANQARPDYDYNLALPGLPKLCTCDHVTNANKMHCPQSVEYWGTGFLEGYAHAFAAAVLNHESSISGDKCAFLYEKEIANETCVAANGAPDCTSVTIDGKSVYLAKTPVKVSCDTPGLWRNRHCGGAGTNSTDPVANTSVELDIMGFLRAVTTRGTDSQRISNSDFISVMRNHIGTGKKVSWEGSTNVDPKLSEYSYRQDGLLQWVGGDSSQPQYLWAVRQADDYGVSTKIY
jgi:hypothetical protein